MVQMVLFCPLFEGSGTGSAVRLRDYPDERLLSWAWWHPRVVGAFASAEPAMNWRWRLDSLAALYQGRHRREAPALRDTPYGSAQALISSPPTSFASQQVAGPSWVDLLSGCTQDQHTTSPAPALGSVVEAAPSPDTPG